LQKRAVWLDVPGGKEEGDVCPTEKNFKGNLVLRKEKRLRVRKLWFGGKTAHHKPPVNWPMGSPKTEGKPPKAALRGKLMVGADLHELVATNKTKNEGKERGNAKGRNGRPEGKT